jgi:hypothetical protein
MARRNYPCTCCNCDQCDQQPTRLIARIAYPEGSGETLAAGSQAGVEWSAVSTTCSVRPENVGVARIRVVSPGENYTSAPALEATGGGGSGLVARVIVESEIVEVEITNPGSGYTSPPQVVFPSGEDTATGVAVIRGPIASVTLQTPGEGYEQPPDVVFSTGTGAEAVATINEQGQVTGIQLLNGGQGYPHNVTVTLAGGTTNATATATINGSVVLVGIQNPGRYTAFRDSPTGLSVGFNQSVFIAGPATANARYSGKVQQIQFGGGSGYTSPPTITLSGGGGEGATAEAELTWQPSHSRSAEFSNCVATVQAAEAFDLQSDPALPSQLAVFAPERFSWLVSAATDGLRRNVATQSPLNPLESLVVRPWFFPDEAIYVRLQSTWLVLGVENVTGQNASVLDGVNQIWVRRFFSRVPPDDRLDIDAPRQPQSATNARIDADWRQYVDSKGDSFWYLEELTFINGGDNLFIPSGTAAVTLKANNSRYRLNNRAATFSYSSPVAGNATISGFTVQPTISVQFSALGGGQYHIASASVGNGGQTTLPDGTEVAVMVPLARGHFIQQARLTGTVNAGVLASISVTSAGLIQGPATLTSINTTLAADPFFSDLSRVATGESVFVTSRTHTEPDVTVESIPSDPEGEEAELRAQLTQAVDANGDDFWYVSAVAIVSEGSGYVSTPVVVFEAERPGIVAIPPVVSVIRSRQQPPGNNLFTVLSAGNGNAIFSFSLVQDTSPQGDAFWRVSDVQLTSAGSGNAVNTTYSVLSSQPVIREVTATITVTGVDGNGAITQFSVQGGRYYVEGTGIGRVVIVNGGKFFVRDINETETELRAVSCIGPVSGETGWTVNRQNLTSSTTFVPVINFLPYSVNVGAFQNLSRVRRCPVPNVTAELE